MLPNDQQTADPSNTSILPDFKTLSDNFFRPFNRTFNNLTHHLNRFFSFFTWLGRERTPFSANITASIALPETIKQSKTTSTNRVLTVLVSVPAKMEALENKCQSITDLSKLDDLILEKLKLVEDSIKEHAARRVDLFFCLLVAVYEKNVIVSKDATVKQHGTGSKTRGTQACHSSLFPNVKMLAAGSLWTQLKSIIKPSFLSGTHLEETLNMTIELPNAVNGFDGRLEGRYQPTKYTKAAIAILNRVSMGELNPKQGMDLFLKTLDQFFSDFEKNVLDKHKCESPKSSRFIWQCQKAGSFGAANKNAMTMSDDYFYLMLRLKPSEIRNVKANPALFKSHYKNLQNEILTSKPVLRHRKPR